MKPLLAIEVEEGSLVRLGAEVAVAGVFQDQRPLRGGAGVADWRMCGWLSGLIESTRVRGAWGESVLLVTHGRIAAPRLVLLGLGARARFGLEAHREAVRAAIDRIVALGAATAVLDLPPPVVADAPERVAETVVAGARAALDAHAAQLLVRIVAPPGQASRMRGALQQVAALPVRSATAIRLVRAPLEAAEGAPPVARRETPGAAVARQPRTR